MTASVGAKKFLICMSTPKIHAGRLTSVLAAKTR
jgi:hypothetical protein